MYFMIVGSLILFSRVAAELIYDEPVYILQSPISLSAASFVSPPIQL